MHFIVVTWNQARRISKVYLCLLLDSLFSIIDQIVLTPAPHCLDYCGFVGSLEVC